MYHAKTRSRNTTLFGWPICYLWLATTTQLKANIKYLIGTSIELACWGSKLLALFNLNVKTRQLTQCINNVAQTWYKSFDAIDHIR